MKKIINMAFIIFASITLISCGQSPEEKAAAEKAKQDEIMLALAKEALQKAIMKESNGSLILAEIYKDNGVEREIFGTKIYQFEYRLIIKTATDIEKISQDKWLYKNWYWHNFGVGRYFYDSFANNIKKYSKDSRIKITGKMDFEKTDNGWRSTGHYENTSSLDL